MPNTTAMARILEINSICPRENMGIHKLVWVSLLILSTTDDAYQIHNNNVTSPYCDLVCDGGTRAICLLTLLQSILIPILCTKPGRNEHRNSAME